MTHVWTDVTSGSPLYDEQARPAVNCRGGTERRHRPVHLRGTVGADDGWADGPAPDEEGM